MMICVQICNKVKGLLDMFFQIKKGLQNCNPSEEGVKKLVHCALVHRVGSLVQALEGGLLNLSHSLIVL